jgi:hypothetical protein
LQLLVGQVKFEQAATQVTSVVVVQVWTSIVHDAHEGTQPPRVVHDA